MKSNIDSLLEDLRADRDALAELVQTPSAGGEGLARLLGKLDMLQSLPELWEPVVARLPFLLAVEDGHPQHGPVGADAFCGYLALGSASPVWNAAASAAELRYRAWRHWAETPLGASASASASPAVALPDLLARHAGVTIARMPELAEALAGLCDTAARCDWSLGPGPESAAERLAALSRTLREAEPEPDRPLPGEDLLRPRFADPLLKLRAAHPLAEAMGLKHPFPLLGPLPSSITAPMLLTQFRRTAEALIETAFALRRLNARRQALAAQAKPPRAAAELMEPIIRLPYLTTARIRDETGISPNTALAVLRWWMPLGRERHVGGREKMLLL